MFVIPTYHCRRFAQHCRAELLQLVYLASWFYVLRRPYPHVYQTTGRSLQHHQFLDLLSRNKYNLFRRRNQGNCIF